MQAQQKRIPKNSTFIGLVPLEAAKSYTPRIFEGTGLEPRIAYADLNTKHEQNDLLINFLPEGNKSAPHPQVVLIRKGTYHWENFWYEKTNPMEWGTWDEMHIDARDLKKLCDAVIRAELALEALRA